MKINQKYGYARVSSKSQEFNSSIESQKQLLIQNEIEEQPILVEIGSLRSEERRVGKECTARCRSRGSP